MTEADQKAIDVGKAKLEQLKADRKAKEEARGASGKSSLPAKTKEELAADEKATKDKQAKDVREKAEAQVKEDERILDAPDDKLDDKAKTRKTELLKIKDKKSKQDKLDKRFSELTSKIKDLETSGKSKNGEMDALKKELADLKKSPASEKDDEKKLEKKAIEDRITKLIEEDKGKPREERREMNDEDLADWLTEDLANAQAWISERTLDRRLFRETYREATRDYKARIALYGRQKPYEDKILAKHPELNTKAREEALKAEGKKPEEIHKILCAENEKYKIVTEIIRANPKEYLDKDNGAELIELELEKRLTKPAKEKTDAEKKAEADKLKADEEARIRGEGAAAEAERLANLDENISSSREGDRDTKSDTDKKREALASKVGISKEALAKSVARRKEMGLPT